jgi:hypothetical protein
MSVTVPAERYGTIALSSLTDEPLEDSHRLMLVVVGRAENTGFTTSIVKNRCLSSGKGPVLCEPINPIIALRTSHSDLKVFPVAASGQWQPPLPTEYKDGKLIFHADHQVLYYHLTTNEPK